jgi:hypothetical protein
MECEMTFKEIAKTVVTFGVIFTAGKDYGESVFWCAWGVIGGFAWLIFGFKARKPDSFWW